MTKAMLIDISKCMGCRGCQVACKQWNQLPAEDTRHTGTYENPPRFTAHTWTKIGFQEYTTEDGADTWIFTKLGCMHCSDAACMKACPAGAISHTEFGTVHIDEKKCIGCNYCIASCPFNVVGFDQAANLAKKCTFCYDRISAGEIPACAKTCPTEAIIYGDRNDMINIAQNRVSELRSNDFPRAEMYGLEELDGLGMMYILTEGKSDSMSKYALPEAPSVPLSTEIWNYIFKPVRVVLVAALAFALWINRNESKKVHADEKA